MNVQIYEEASEWIILHRTDDLDAEERRRFDAWLRESPQHLRAYLEMSTLWEDVPVLNRDWNPSADELIARARAEGNVLPLTLEKLAPSKVPGTGGEALPLGALNGLELIEASKALNTVDKHSTATHSTAPASSELQLEAVPVITVPVLQAMRMKLLAIAAGLLMTVGIASWFYLQRGLYATDTGEQLTIALRDGSTIQLNAQSKLRVHYTDEERSIDLIQGQALFKVAKEPSRPFIVDSDGTRVRAVGTQFDVYKKNTGTQITVVEGRVAVDGGASLHRLSSSPRAPSAPHANHALQAQLGELLLSAGEQILIAETTPAPELAAPEPSTGTVPVLPKTLTQAPVKVQAANIEAATAWTQQRLIFDFTPLTEVAQEFNRYNRRTLVIEDASLRDFNISGSFSSTDPTLLLRFLRDQPGIVVNETADEIRISRHEASTG